MFTVFGIYKGPNKLIEEDTGKVYKVFPFGRKYTINLNNKKGFFLLRPPQGVQDGTFVLITFLEWSSTKP